MTGINFWNKNGGSVNDVTSSSAASVMLQESETGLLTVAVSDPTMKNKETIQITLRKPVASEERLDENVTCEQKVDGSTVLTFQMEGTNGASSMAELQLQARLLRQQFSWKRAAPRSLKSVITVWEFSRQNGLYREQEFLWQKVLQWMKTECF